MADYIRPVVFKLGDEYYGVDINLVIGIEKEMKIVRVPNTVDYIKGIINLRGEAIPVYDLKKKFNMTADAKQGNNLIIVKLYDIKVAFDVDEVNEISDISPENIVKMPVLVQTDEVRYFDRIAHVGGKLIILMDINYLTTESERKRIHELKEEMQKS